MHSPLLNPSLLLLFLSFPLPTLTTPQTLHANAWALGAVDDLTSSGNYLIYSCSTTAPTLANLLSLTYLYLQTALLSSTPTDPSYAAFFRTAPPLTITTILTAITLGTNITTARHGSRRPTLVCANPHDTGIATFWNLCRDSPDTVVVIQPPETSVVFLCPIFFTRPLSPEASDDCPVVAGSKLVGPNYGAATQYAFLVRVLAEMYIREAGLRPGVRGQRPRPQQDARDENACLALPPDQAVRNPSSYAFFAASIRAGCTDFPRNVPIQRDRELLTTDDSTNSTDTPLTLECVGNGTVESANNQCSG